MPAELLLGAFHCVDLGVDVPAQVFHGRGNPLVLAGEAVGNLAHKKFSIGEQGAHPGAQGAGLFAHGGLGILLGSAFGLAEACFDAVEALGRAEAVPAELFLCRLEFVHALLKGSGGRFRASGRQHFGVLAQAFHGTAQLFVLAGEAVSHLAHEIIPGGE